MIAADQEKEEPRALGILFQSIGTGTDFSHQLLFQVRTW